MFGLGLTQKIIDCYVAIISVWQPGDRIYLFGFSRGAYTARCVSHVLEVCGIPTREPDGKSLNLDPTSLRNVAAEAARCLYTLGMPIVDEKTVAARAEKIPEGSRVAGRTRCGCDGVFDRCLGCRGRYRVAAFLPRLGIRPPFRQDVRYARHLQSIDEGRKDFKRVPCRGQCSAIRRRVLWFQYVLGWGRHPNLDFLRRPQNDRHRFGMDGLNNVLKQYESFLETAARHSCEHSVQFCSLFS